MNTTDSASPMDEISIVSRPSDPVDKQKYVFILIPQCAWERRRTAKMQLQDVKVKWKNSTCPVLTKNSWETMENLFNSSGIFSQDFRHCRFFSKSWMICESGTLNLRLDKKRK